MKTHPKHAILTGSTGGIGSEISKMLAADGWSLGLVNRSVEKAEKQRDELRQAFPAQNFEIFTADLMDLVQIKRVVAEIDATFPKISALYHVAGFLSDKRVTTPQGIEGHFATNTVAPYLLTQELRGALSAGSQEDHQSVIVNFSTSAINMVKKLDVDSLVNPPEIGGLMGAYAKTKMAQTILAKALEEELLEEGTLILNIDPGPTKSSMTKSGEGMPWIVRLLQPVLFKDPAKQAQKIVSAVDEAVADQQTGLYISEGNIKELPQAKLVLNKAVQSELRSLLDSRTEAFR